MSDPSAGREERSERPLQVHEGLSQYEDMRNGMFRTVLKWAFWFVLVLLGLLIVYRAGSRLVGAP